VAQRTEAPSSSERQDAEMTAGQMATDWRGSNERVVIIGSGGALRRELVTTLTCSLVPSRTNMTSVHCSCDVWCRGAFTLAAITLVLPWLPQWSIRRMCLSTTAWTGTGGHP